MLPGNEGFVGFDGDPLDDSVPSLGQPSPVHVVPPLHAASNTAVSEPSARRPRIIMASYDGRLRHLPERLALSLKGGAIGAIVPHLIGTPELVMRIAIGAALGGVIGYERRHHRRPVGLRTHLIVAMAAATFMVISSQFVYYQHYGKEDLVTVDSSRIAASVVSGIGFLAGGAILRTGLTVQGLTTAAGLWLVTAIGMSAGSGMFTVSAVVTAMGIVALTLLRRFENKDDSIRRRMVVVTDDEADIDQDSTRCSISADSRSRVISDVLWGARSIRSWRRASASRTGPRGDAGDGVA